MIVRWMAVGFVLWIAIALAFRFAGELAFHAGPWGVSWLFMCMPLVLFAVISLLLMILRVAPSDRSEAASIMAVPGLAVGVYEINSFGFVFPNLDPALAGEFAILMFASYAAVIAAGRDNMNVRWMAVGFAFWLAIAFGFRFGGEYVFQPGPGGVSWMFLVMPLAFLIITYIVLQAMRVPQTDRSEAASIIAVPGFLIGIYEIDRFGDVFPNLDPSLSPEFSALMFASIAAVILAGIVSSRLESI